MSNYPDDIAQYNWHIDSPFYDGFEDFENEEYDEIIDYPDDDDYFYFGGEFFQSNKKRKD